MYLLQQYRQRIHWNITHVCSTECTLTTPHPASLLINSRLAGVELGLVTSCVEVRFLVASHIWRCEIYSCEQLHHHHNPPLHWGNKTSPKLVPFSGMASLQNSSQTTRIRSHISRIILRPIMILSFIFQFESREQNQEGFTLS